MDEYIRKWENIFINDISDKGLTSKNIQRAHTPQKTKKQIIQLKNGQRS